MRKDGADFKYKISTHTIHTFKIVESFFEFRPLKLYHNHKRNLCNKQHNFIYWCSCLKKKQKKQTSSFVQQAKALAYKVMPEVYEDFQKMLCYFGPFLGDTFE